MMKTNYSKLISSKVMWVGRATVFTVGLAVTLALVLGVSTTALAAVPGDPFRLGQLNSINRISQLVGSTTSAILRIDNNGTGSALQISVEPDRPPLTVNGTAGKALNLNADKLDGYTADDFYYYNEKVNDSARADFAEDSGHADYAERANDSALLNGMNSPQFFTQRTRTYLVSTDRADGGGGSTLSVEATCDPGDKVLSGGGGKVLDASSDELISDAPYPPNGWQVVFRDNGESSHWHVDSLCADFPPYRP
jgi:hypothetical protein